PRRLGGGDDRNRRAGVGVRRGCRVDPPSPDRRDRRDPGLDLAGGKAVRRLLPASAPVRCHHGGRRARGRRRSRHPFLALAAGSLGGRVHARGNALHQAGRDVMAGELALEARPHGGRDQVARAWTAVRTESALAVLAIGLLGLHVVDDSFLQPQTGTSAADHLVSGLVPLALLVLFAVRYGRMRAGPRGTLAIAVGLFGIAGGLGEAGYYSLHGGPAG